MLSRPAARRVCKAEGTRECTARGGQNSGSSSPSAWRTADVCKSQGPARLFRPEKMPAAQQDRAGEHSSGSTAAAGGSTDCPASHSLMLAHTSSKFIVG